MDGSPVARRFGSERLGQLLTSIRRHLCGAPKWDIRSHRPLQLVGLEGLDKNQALCTPVRPVALISVSSRNFEAGLQAAAR